MVPREGHHWKDVVVPKPYPQEFRDDVVRVARSRDGSMTIKQIAKDFGISETCLNNWMRKAERGERGTT